MAAIIASRRHGRPEEVGEGSISGYGHSVPRMIELLGGDPVTGDDLDARAPLRDLVKRSCYFPVFVNWNSWFPSTIYDDLVELRYGRRLRQPAWGWLTAPLVLAGRLAGALGSLPLEAMQIVQNQVEGARSAMTKEGDGPWLVGLDVAAYLGLYPVYLASNPLLKGLGTPAWEVMKRRADLAAASQLPPRVRRERTRDPADQSEGAAYAMIRHLGDALKDKPYKTSVTLVGHSMGAMLLNRVIAIAGDNLPVKSIVYLAPAASLDDVWHLALPYARKNQYRH